MVKNFDEYRCKNHRQNISKPNPMIHEKGLYTMINLDLFQAHMDGSTYANQSM